MAADPDAGGVEGAPRAAGRARLGAVALAAVATFVTWLFLKTESEAVLGALLLSVAVAAFAVRRLGLLGAAGVSERALGVAVSVGLLVVVAALHDDHFSLLLLARVLLTVMACLGLHVQFGQAGVANFAAAAFFGVGGYTAAVLAAHGVPHLLVLVAAGVMAAAIGSVLLLPLLRTRGHYAALITIAFGLLFRTFVEVNDALGGPQGLKLPPFELFGWRFDTFSVGDVEISMYVLYSVAAYVALAASWAVVRRLETSWVGLALDAVRLDETAAACFGIGIPRWKIAAFTLGNFITGVAGALSALLVGFIAPNNFTFRESLVFVSIVLLGGLGNLWGLAVASFIVVALPEKLQGIQEYRFLLFSILVILVLVFRPGGLVPRPLRRHFGRGGRERGRPEEGGPERVASTRAPAPSGAPLPSKAPLLSCRDLTRRFGGLVALDHLSFDLEPGQILGLIGPNGSGKTTFFNVLTGIYPASEGQITFAGTPITNLSPQAVYQAGVARTFQRSRLCLPLTVFDNVMVGNHKNLSHGLRFNISRGGALRRQFEEARAETHELLRIFDARLAERMFDPVSGVPMIDRRRIEICRALVSRPRLLLLDEPSAGMTHDETMRLMDDILEVRRRFGDLTIVLIEHEMSVIERVTDRCIVLNFGKKLCEGTYAEIAADPQVQQAYLGVA